MADKKYEYLTLDTVWNTDKKVFDFKHNKEIYSHAYFENLGYRLVYIKWGKGVFKREISD